MSRPAERVFAFNNKRGTCEQWIKEGKGVIKWTRLSLGLSRATRCGSSFMRSPNNLGYFLRTLATPEPETFDRYPFHSNRRQEYVQMPGKMTKSILRPPFRMLALVAVAVVVPRSGAKSPGTFAVGWRPRPSGRRHSGRG
jgi:hypothetical protein